MSETAAIALVGLTVLVLLLVTVGGIHYLRDVLSEEEHDDHGGGGAAH